MWHWCGRPELKAESILDASPPLAGGSRPSTSIAVRCDRTGPDQPDILLLSSPRPRSPARARLAILFSRFYPRGPGVQRGAWP